MIALERKHGATRSVLFDVISAAPETSICLLELRAVAIYSSLSENNAISSFKLFEGPAELLQSTVYIAVFDEITVAQQRLQCKREPALVFEAETLTEPGILVRNVDEVH